MIEILFALPPTERIWSRFSISRFHGQIWSDDLAWLMILTTCAGNRLRTVTSDRYTIIRRFLFELVIISLDGNDREATNLLFVLPTFFLLEYTEKTEEILQFLGKRWPTCVAAPFQRKRLGNFSFNVATLAPRGSQLLANKAANNEIRNEIRLYSSAESAAKVKLERFRFTIWRFHENWFVLLFEYLRTIVNQFQ